MVNFTIRVHLNHCHNALRAGCLLGDRELGAQSDAREPSALIGNNCSSVSEDSGQSPVL